MKRFVKACNLFCFVGWTLLCLSAATGVIEVGIEDYCVVTGLLALENVINLVM